MPWPGAIIFMKVSGFRSMKDLLAGSATSLYAQEDFVGGEMQNGKWMRQGSYKAMAVAPPYGDGE